LTKRRTNQNIQTITTTPNPQTLTLSIPKGNEIMTNQPAPITRDLNPDRTLDSLFPSRFLKPDTLIEWGKTTITVTIAGITEEEVEPKPGRKEFKPVLYFKTKDGKTTHPQGYLLSAKADKDALKASTSATTVGELTGKLITIKQDTWRSKAVLRIDPAPAGLTIANPMPIRESNAPAPLVDPPTTQEENPPKEKCTECGTMGEYHAPTCTNNPDNAPDFETQVDEVAAEAGKEEEPPF
jgi:hypothetical protein